MFTDLQLITLTTDFGGSYYVGEMKGVMKKVNPKAEVVDVTHAVGRQNILEGAFILSRVWRHFPKNTIHVAVVDPGVGSDRKALAVETDYCMLIGPDNGILRWALKDQKVARAVELNAGEVQARAGLKGLSATFHGRDVFAPAAARLSAGTPVSRLGAAVSDLQTLPPPRLVPGDVPAAALTSAVRGEILLADRFGNLLTSIGVLCAGPGFLRIDPWIPGCPQMRLEGPGFRVHLPGGRAARLVHTFSDVPPGSLLAYIGSDGLLEIGVNEGSAAEVLGLPRGAEVVLTAAG